MYKCKILEKLQMISIKSNNKFSIISIDNWEEYQGEEQQKNNKRTTKEQQSNTNKNVKNIYLYYLNKYKGENHKSFYSKMKFLREIKKDERYIELSPYEESELRTLILGE